ncbi:hypothetical protein ACJZ2D_012730 [Fusarium nematophilum]
MSSNDNLESSTSPADSAAESPKPTLSLERFLSEPLTKLEALAVGAKSSMGAPEDHIAAAKKKVNDFDKRWRELS